MPNDKIQQWTERCWSHYASVQGIDGAERSLLMVGRKQTPRLMSISSDVSAVLVDATSAEDCRLAMGTAAVVLEVSTEDNRCPVGRRVTPPPAASWLLRV